MTERSFSEGLSVIRAAEAPCPLESGEHGTPLAYGVHYDDRSPRKLLRAFAARLLGRKL
jgi:hypothetical protein